jgi:excisionase family DNA binding protein
MENRQRRLMTPAEVAKLFGIAPNTLVRWANQGKLSCIRTIGGHRRFHTAEVLELFRQASTKPTQTPV